MLPGSGPTVTNWLDFDKYLNMKYCIIMKSTTINLSFEVPKMAGLTPLYERSRTHSLNPFCRREEYKVQTINTNSDADQLTKL